MIKAIIFDADGTLYNVRTKRAYCLAADFLSSKIGIPSEKIVAEWKITIDEINNSPIFSRDPIKRQRKYSLKKTLLRFGVEEERVDPLAAKALDIFWDEAIKDLEVFPEVKASMEKMKGKYIIAIASEEFEENLVRKLDHVFGDWQKYFKVLITPETTGAMKPSEKYCEEVLKLFKLNKAEVVAVGDSDERDLNPAKKIGIKTIKIAPCEFSKLIRKIPTKK